MGATHLKAMDDTGVVMTPFGDVDTIWDILVVNSYIFGFLCYKSGVAEVC